MSKTRRQDDACTRSRTKGVVLGLGLLVALVAGILFVQQMTLAVHNATVSNMRELANHDINYIQTYLERNLASLDHIADRIELQPVYSTYDLKREIHEESVTSEFSEVFLVDEEGTLYNDDYKTVPPDNNPYLALFEQSESEFIETQTIEAQDGKPSIEYLTYGLKITPFTTAGITFTGILGVDNISLVRANLNIESYNGQGYSSLIDESGNYIVGVADKDSFARSTENYFDELRNGQINGQTSEDVIKEIENGNPVLVEWTTSEGTKVQSIVEPISSIDWSFVITIPEAVYLSQSRTLIGMTSIALIAILAVIVGVVLWTQHLSRKTAEAQASARARSDFLSNLSHEIRTPLTGIVGLNHLMQHHSNEPDKVQEYAEQSETITRYLLSLINDILDMSRINSGTINVTLGTVNLPTLVNDVCTMQKDTYAARKVSLDVETDIEHPWVITDGLHLKQVLMNILGNAAKFTPEGGNVRFTVSQIVDEDNRIITKATIKDTGIGMSPEFIKSIFDPFSQERSRNSESQKGTGLGMAISHKFIEAMGGTITVESELGKGSCFTVTLPVEPAQPTQPAQPAQPVPEEFASHTAIADAVEDDTALDIHKILLVEDNLLNATILTDILTESGFEIEHALDGVHAIELFEASDVGYYDVVLMDLQMPRKNGFDAARDIRSLDREDATTIPIIACSANCFQEDIDMAMESGMNGFLEKPVQVDAMLDTLRQASFDSSRNEQRTV